MPKFNVKYSIFRFKGLMTIGKQGDYQAFLQMVELKNKII